MTAMWHIIEKCYGWRVEDYDGYNDYYVNHEYNQNKTVIIQQEEEEI